MYGPQAREAAPVSSDLAAVQVGLIPDRSGQVLRNQLVRLLNPAAGIQPGRYTLSVALKETIDTFAVERSGFATTANIEVVATYTLMDDATGNPVLAGTSRAISGYNLLDNDFSTYVAAGDARTRAVDQIAFEIRNPLAAHFSKQARSPADGT
jgi:LPS-assembly lipoprotein